MYVVVSGEVGMYINPDGFPSHAAANAPAQQMPADAYLTAVSEEEDGKRRLPMAGETSETVDIAPVFGGTR